MVLCWRWSLAEGKIGKISVQLEIKMYFRDKSLASRPVSFAVESRYLIGTFIANNRSGLKIKVAPYLRSNEQSFVCLKNGQNLAFQWHKPSFIPSPRGLLIYDIIASPQMPHAQTLCEQSGTKPNLVAKILATKFGFVPDWWTCWT